jgi:hypothetical protein
MGGKTVSGAGAVRRSVVVVGLAIALSGCASGAATSEPSAGNASASLPASSSQASASASGGAAGGSLAPISDHAGVTAAMNEPGSLGITLDQFVSQWNGVLAQHQDLLKDQYRLTGDPQRNGAQFVYTPNEANETVLVGMLNDDGTVRAISGLSVAKGLFGETERQRGQLESLVIWKTLLRATDPKLSETQASDLLARIGYRDSVDQFGKLQPMAAEVDGRRYYIVEDDTTTNLIVRPA